MSYIYRSGENPVYRMSELASLGAQCIVAAACARRPKLTHKLSIGSRTAFKMLASLESQLLNIQTYSVFHNNIVCLILFW